LYIGNLGDSQAVLFRNDEYLLLSSVHDLKNADELHQVESKGGTVLNNRLEGELALTRSIGDINFKRFMSSDPEILVHELKEGDEYLFLATDGYWNVRK
jgi:serine/threonine protein phosphatase PrpC